MGWNLSSKLLGPIFRSETRREQLVLERAVDECFQVVRWTNFLNREIAGGKNLSVLDWSKTTSTLKSGALEDWIRALIVAIGPALKSRVLSPGTNIVGYNKPVACLHVAINDIKWVFSSPKIKTIANMNRSREIFNDFLKNPNFLMMVHSLTMTLLRLNW